MSAFVSRQWIHLIFATLLAACALLFAPVVSWALEDGGESPANAAVEALGPEDGGVTSDDVAAEATVEEEGDAAAEPAADLAAEPATPEQPAEPDATASEPANEAATDEPEPTPSAEAPEASQEEAPENVATADEPAESSQPAAEPVAAPEPAATTPVTNPATPPRTTAAQKAPAAPTTSETPSGETADDPAKHPLADGTYALVWAKSTKLIAQSAKNSRKSGTNVLVAKDSGPTRQRWIVKYSVKYGYYTIVNEFTKRVLTVASGKNKANVFQSKAKAGDNAQLWSIVKVGKSYLFQPALNAKLALTGYAKNGGYDLFVKKLTSTTDQLFLPKKKGIVQKGIYSLSLKKNSKKVAEVPNYSMEQKAKFRLNAYNGDLTQKFQVKYLGDDLYTLQSVHSGQYLGAAGTAIVQMPDATAAAQQWKVSWNKTGLAFTNAKSGKRLQVPNASTKNKVKLKAAAAANDDAQRFVLTERRVVANGMYIVHTFAGNRALAVADGSFAELANINAQTVSDSNSQKFRIKYVKNNRYKIINVKSGMLAGSATDKAGANVRQRTDHNSAKQLWKATVAPGGGIQFVGVASGKVLDIAGTTEKSGANVRVAKADGTKEQRWWLERTQENADEAVVDKALRKAQSKGSATNYFIAVDVTNHRTIIFKRSNNTWKVEKNWICSVGAPSTPTVLGTYTVGIKGYSFGDGYTCYYYTQFYGDYLFHSVKYYQNTFKVKDGRLGQNVSEGCVRLQLKNAKWIYNNIPSSTRVVTYK